MNPFKWALSVYRWYRDTSDSVRFVEYLRRQGVRIGEHVSFQMPRQSVIDLTRPWLIEIGNSITFGNYFTLLTHGYDCVVLQGTDGEIIGSAGKVKIGNNVFIGANVTVLKGVTIGDNVVVGAGSVVTASLPSNGLYAGNPCRKISDLEPYWEKRRAAQLDEAKECALEYYKVTGQVPDKIVMRDFFLLFEDDLATLPARFRKKFGNKGHEAVCLEFFKNHKAPFPNYEAFLEYCGLPANAAE